MISLHNCGSIQMILAFLALHKKMKFSITDFFSKCDQIRSFIFCAVTLPNMSDQSIEPNVTYFKIPISNFLKWRKIPYDPNVWRRKSFIGLKFSSNKQKYLTFTIDFWNSFSATFVNHISDRSGCSCYFTRHFKASEKTFIVRKQLLEQLTFKDLKSQWKYLKTLINLFKIKINDIKMIVFI